MFSPPVPFATTFPGEEIVLKTGVVAPIKPTFEVVPFLSVSSKVAAGAIARPPAPPVASITSSFC